MNGNVCNGVDRRQAGFGRPGGLSERSDEGCKTTVSRPRFGRSSQFPVCPKADGGWLLFEWLILGHCRRFLGGRSTSASVKGRHSPGCRDEDDERPGRGRNRALSFSA